MFSAILWKAASVRIMNVIGMVVTRMACHYGGYQRMRGRTWSILLPVVMYVFSTS